MSSPPITLTPEILVPRIGDYLVEKGLISSDALQIALELQNVLRSQGKQILLGQVLVDSGSIDRQLLDQAVTEQIIQLRTALQETNQQLENRVQERTAELKNALDKLSELSQLKSNIVANISHELRTPLTHIKGYVDLLLSQGLGQLSEPQLNALQVVQRSSDRLERQIEDLIHFSMASRGEFTIRLKPVNLVSLFTAILHRTRAKAVERQVELILDCPPELPCLKADEEKISWVLMQLMDNAIKFTPNGGKVTLAAVVDQDLVIISVTDTGIGIPENRMAEIFEPFHQLDGSATRQYGGTGLGLALVKQIIDAHGSHINIKTQLGKGSRFDFILPIYGD